MNWKEEKTMVNEEKLLEIFKQTHFQGDSYYCRINNKGDKYIVGYKNDYPMQHGSGKEWTIPIEVAEMLAGQVEPEVMVNFADIIELLELFIAYGMIYTVGGVTYPNGTHKETIDKANKLLWRLRNESKISA